MPEYFWEGNLNDMISGEILDGGIGEPHFTDGFSIGKRGKAKFYMWDFTPNGYCKLYEQNEKFEIIGIRYVDATLTNVRVHKNINP